MAHKKGGGSSANNRDSRSKRLGVKRFDGEAVHGGTARSLRNGFRASLGSYPAGVERRNSVGGLPAYPPKPNSEYRRTDPGSQSAGEKLRAREGKNPDRRPRPPSRRSVAKEVGSR